MEPRRIYNHRSTHYQPHRSAASDPGYRSLRAFLLVKRQGAMDHLRKSRPHETHARERSGDRRERSHVPHSARPISLFRIGQSQAKGTPRDIIGKLNAAAVDALADPVVRSRLAALGLEVFPRDQQTPEALAALQRADA